jgi:hypothetical protein
MAKMKKPDGLAIVIGIGKTSKMKSKLKKPEMMYGGMASGKRHMYNGGGSVTDNLPNKGLKELAKTDKGKSAVRNMGFNV